MLASVFTACLTTMSQSFISISDLSHSATSIIKWLKETWDQIVLIDNKPSAVIIDYDKYQEMIDGPLELVEYSFGDLSEEDKKLVKEVKKMPDSAFTDL